MSDYISRADAIEAVRGLSVLVDDKDFQHFEDALKALPSAELPKGDLISRADVLKYPIRLDHYDEVNGSRDFVYGVESVIEYVESLPSAEAVQGWIPCSERLPEAEDMYQPPEQRYLCQLEAHGMRKFCVLSRLKGAVSPFWDWYGIAVYDSEVIAWMPLPKPYREENE